MTACHAANAGCNAGGHGRTQHMQRHITMCVVLTCCWQAAKGTWCHPAAGNTQHVQPSPPPFPPKVATCTNH